MAASSEAIFASCSAARLSETAPLWDKDAAGAVSALGTDVAASDAAATASEDANSPSTVSAGGVVAPPSPTSSNDCGEKLPSLLGSPDSLPATARPAECSPDSLPATARPATAGVPPAASLAPNEEEPVPGEEDPLLPPPPTSGNFGPFATWFFVHSGCFCT